MKVCPLCHNTFNDALNFCLNDGTPLAPAAATEVEAPTMVTNREPQVVVPIPQQPATPVEPQFGGDYNQSIPNQPPAPARKSNTGLIVFSTALVTLLLAGAGIGGYWFLTRNREVAQNSANTNAATPGRNSNLAAGANANSAANANLAPSPSPSPTLNPKQVAAVKSEVQESLDGWAMATEVGDLDEHMSFYAPSVEYYKAGVVNQNRIREDRQKAFAAYNYDKFVTLSNVRITPDASGNKATVVLDKEYEFDGEEKYLKGKVQQQLTLEKIGKKWQITGEKDLKVYTKETE